MDVTHQPGKISPKNKGTLALIHNRLKICNHVRDTILMKSWEVPIESTFVKFFIQGQRSQTLIFRQFWPNGHMFHLLNRRKRNNDFWNKNLLAWAFSYCLFTTVMMTRGEASASHFSVNIRVISLTLYFLGNLWNNHLNDQQQQYHLQAKIFTNKAVPNFF